ncbi:hypothetical protein [Eupransor demetentiae]|uniref:Uncharacterized protein n=1 Tax=Eupransor demetentiae TaxID=3109584 RepID=A0ABM9N668_9LACO|nr:hypothetical protein R54876_GBNLAHCA_01299 [Lactobacillaceae bacterium LMG 33000]
MKTEFKKRFSNLCLAFSFAVMIAMTISMLYDDTKVYMKILAGFGVLAIAFLVSRFGQNLVTLMVWGTLLILDVVTMIDAYDMKAMIMPVAYLFFMVAYFGMYLFKGIDLFDKGNRINAPIGKANPKDKNKYRIAYASLGLALLSFLSWFTLPHYGQLLHIFGFGADDYAWAFLPLMVSLAVYLTMRSQIALTKNLRLALYVVVAVGCVSVVTMLVFG